MSSAKRTPRHVKTVPTNLRIVGPTVEAQVIPIRRITPAFVPAIVEPAPTSAPRRATRFVPVARRPWRVLLVSSTPGVPTRSFDVGRWQARIAIAGLALLLVMAGGAMTAVVTAVEAPDLFVTSADAALLRARLLDVEDSLTLVRAELASAQEESSDSLLADEPIIKTPAASRMSSARNSAVRKPLARRTPRIAESEAAAVVAAGPRSVEGLPVVGMIASGFSRSRRHPILHIRRPHLGVDVAAPRGTPVTAPAPGRVSYVGRRFGFGLVVEIQHADGVKTRYAHLRAAMVQMGAQLERGVEIGTVGSSGITTGPHLHYEVLVNGRQVDPLRFRLPQPVAIDSAAVRTLPAAPVLSPPAAPPVAPSFVAPPTATHDSIAPAQVAPSGR